MTDFGGNRLSTQVTPDTRPDKVEDEPLIGPGMAKDWLLGEGRAVLGEDGELEITADDTFTLTAHALHAVGVAMPFSEAYKAVAGNAASISDSVLGRFGQTLVDRYIDAPAASVPEQA